MVTLAPGKGTTLVEGTTDQIGVVLTAEIARRFPLNVGLLVASQIIVRDTAGSVWAEDSAGEFLILAGMVEDDGEDIALPGWKAQRVEWSSQRCCLSRGRSSSARRTKY